MPEIITCPTCQRRLMLPEGLRGVPIRCPSCQSEFQAEPPPTLPLATPVEEPAAAPQRETWIDWNSPPASPFQFDHRPRPQPRVKWWRALVVVVLAMAILSAIGRVLQPPQPNWQPAGIPLEDPDLRRQEVAQAFHGELPAEGEAAAAVKSMLQELGDALRARNGAKAASCFDIDRMFDEMVAQGLLAADARRQRWNITRGMGATLGEALVRQAPLMEWTSLEIRQAKQVKADELVVIARHRGPEGASLKMRWWVRRHADGAWRIYDMEDLDLGMRFSALAGTMAGRGLADLQAVSEGVNHLRDALLAIVQNQDADTAEKKLKLIVAVKFPAPLEGVRLMTSSLVLMHRGDDEKALELLDQAQRINPDMPALDLMKGITYNRLGRHDQALKHLETYRKLLGDDAILCHELGLALHHRSRFAEASAMYRKALDEDPANAETFMLLLRAVEPNDPRDDLGQRFLKLNDARLRFPDAADECRQREDGKGLELICLAMLKLDPKAAAADFNLALAKVWLGQPDEAPAHFRAALAKDPDSRAPFTRDLARELVRTGKALEAYAILPDPREAFAVLLGELASLHRPNDMRKLLAAHAVKHANDPLVPFARGVVYHDDGLFHLADQAFQAGLAKPPDAATLEKFRRQRVESRFWSGQALAAYAQIGPSRETFEELASLAYYQHEDALLEKLIAAHVVKHGDDPWLTRYRCRLKIRQGQVAEAGKLFQASLAQVEDDNEREDRTFEFLDNLAAAGRALEGYPVVPDARMAFRILGQRLLERRREADLEKLIAAHSVKHADDCWIAFLRGEQKLRDRDWPAAAQVFQPLLMTCPEELVHRVRTGYLEAMYRDGKALDAYREAEESWRLLAFSDLTQRLVKDKKADELLALVDLRRPRTKNDSDLPLAQARAKILLQQPAEAAKLVQDAFQKESDDFRRRMIVNDFCIDMARAGRPLEAYRQAPDQAIAFGTLASWLVDEKQAKELEGLLAEHGRDNANDRQLLFHQGEMHLLKGDGQAAEQAFLTALAQAPPQEQFRPRHGLFRARLKLGRMADTYREFGPEYLDTLTQLCTADKNVKELRALLTAHRQADPNDPRWPAHDLELRYLKGDHEGTLKLIEEHRQGLFAMPRYRWRAESCQVRSLIKLKRIPEAIQAAERLQARQENQAVLLVLAFAAAGDVKQVCAALEKVGPQPWLIRQCYEDDDLGPLIQGEPFKEFRDRFPKPDPEERDRLDDLD